MDAQPIEVALPSLPVYRCRSWPQAVTYALAVWLRSRWPLDRRRVDSGGPGGVERREQCKNERAALREAA